MILGCILSIYIIVIIVKFARFTLTSAQFQIQSIVAVIIGLLGIVLYLARQDRFYPVILGSETVVSFGICIYVAVIRRRIKKGDLEEMTSPLKEYVGPESGREGVSTVEISRTVDWTAAGPPNVAT